MARGALLHVGIVGFRLVEVLLDGEHRLGVTRGEVSSLVRAAGLREQRVALG